MSKTHKADLHIELPEGVDANVLVLMYDTEKLSEKTASEMKMKVGAAIHKALENYPEVSFKAYKVLKNDETNAQEDIAC